MKNKKGSHLGIVFSLIIFVGFLVFLYIIAAPGLIPQKDKTLAMEQLKIKLPESFSADLTEISLLLIAAPGGDCAEINHFAGFETLNYIVKDKNKNPIGSSSLGVLLEMAFTGDTFYKLFYSEEPFDNFPRSGDCETTAYNIESSKTSKKVFETTIVEFIGIYNDDYEDLKESLNIAFETDFSFKFTDKGELVVGPDITDKTLEIYVEEIPLEYVDAEANLNPGILTISVW